jgi:fermentation-respiration switch protein FrsA (DUF1100 family)
MEDGMIIVYILAGLLPLFLLASYGAYRKTFHQNRRKAENIYAMPKRTPEETVARTREMIRALDAVDYEPIGIRSEDGLYLFGRYYHVSDGAPLHIQMHGYRSFAMRDFCGGNPMVRERGHNTLVVDQRAHGRSEGNTITFGIKEKQDCLLWARYASRRFGSRTPIFLSGVSMGAATVLMASELELPANVVGIIADCPYSSPRAIIRKVIGDMKLPVWAAYPLVCFGARVFGGIRDLNGEGAVRAVRHARVPVLLIHGASDGFVPCEMSREIADACASPVRLELFDGADHAMSYLTDTDRYTQVSAEFTEACIDHFNKR